MKYSVPNKKLSAFTCPHCGVYAQMKYSEHNFKEDEICMSSNDYIDTNTTTLARCANCGNKIIWIKDEYVYPNSLPISPNEDMPNVVKVLYKEAGLIYTKSPRAACALLRLAIDRLCNELGETDRDINKNIASLVKRGISVEVQQALDIVRVVGNKAVHPGQITFDVDNVETAETLFTLINLIVDRLISEPKRIDEMFDKLPENVKNAVKKRDE
jgi:predicted RNA-binding Zn-ribbon protein involved in translation (DUF1610 family)